jgi:hypothetical protein
MATAVDAQMGYQVNWFEVTSDRTLNSMPVGGEVQLTTCRFPFLVSTTKLSN